MPALGSGVAVAAFWRFERSELPGGVRFGFPAVVARLGQYRACIPRPGGYRPGSLFKERLASVKTAINRRRKN